MKGKFYPLWFVDIIRTENMLSKMSQQGLHPAKFSPFTGVFSFNEGEQGEYRYRICLSRGCNGEAPKGLISGGWEKMCGTRNMYIVRTADKDTQNVPSYSKWLTINRTVLIALFFILCFFAGLFIGAAASAIDTDESFLETVIPTQRYIAVPLLLFILFFIPNRKMNKQRTGPDTNMKGKVIKTIPAENFIYTPEQEKQMIKDKTIIKKSPLGWFYAPDTAEKMVHDMAQQGWKFYRFNNMGTEFYFVKSEPCKIKMVVDYQNETTDEYLEAARDDGWRLDFTSISRMGGFIIWSKEYTDTEPDFYSDDEFAYKHAKRRFLAFGLPLMFSTVVMALLIAEMLSLAESTDTMGFILAVVFGAVAIEYLFFGIKTTLYFIRMRKKYKSK